MATLAEISNSLSSFLEANPTSALEESGEDDNKTIIVRRPWDDGSIFLSIPEDATALIDALNNLHLPPRLSAIYHRDTRKLEIIWTAFPLRNQLREVAGRTFKFSYVGNEHICSFSLSSDRLMEIARNVKFSGQSETNQRNLLPFQVHAAYVQLPNYQELAKMSGSIVDLPRSFWIDNVDFDDMNTIILIEHLNFYLTYYDTISPHILIHTPKLGSVVAPKLRYIEGSFPNTISSRELDTTLIGFWKAAKDGDPARRFLYYFRLLEYASMVYIDSKTKLAVAKCLALPSALDNIDDLTDKVISLLYKTDATDFAKMDILLRDTVEPKMLWKEIENNREMHCRKHLFDGGFEIAPIIAATTTLETYIPAAVTNFHKNIRDIRNALSHGKDQKTSTVILPTIHNFERLEPWAAMISVAAGEVILYRNVL